MPRPRRVLSGMRPTGGLHLGHWCGVLQNWRQLQQNADCFFFVADWHALTTNYAAIDDIAAHTREMVLTWLAAGIDGERAALFVQSQVLEHAELHLLLSMSCPLPKLTQLPTYKEQKENLNHDLDTYGFLGYPLLQSADILIYRADDVPVGEDQKPHVEFTREVARRFNRLYGGGDGFADAVRPLLEQLPPAARRQLDEARKEYRRNGDQAVLAGALMEIESLAPTQKQRALLRGYCLYEAEEILTPPETLLTSAARVPGTDGRKMSKSYGNTIELFESEKGVEEKLTRMKTDPARMRRSDKGNPDNCPVWELHKHFSDTQSQEWVRDGCTTAAIGCVECKKRLSAHVNTVLQPLRDNRARLERDGATDAVEATLARGVARARDVAGETMADVRRAMRLPGSNK